MLILHLFCCIIVYIQQCHSENKYTVRAVTKPVIHAEGPYWAPSEQSLYYVDVAGFGVHKYNTHNNTHSSIKFKDTVNFIIPIRDNPGTFAIGYGRNLTILKWDGTSTCYKVNTKYNVDADKLGNRINDAKADVLGSLWFGTMGEEKPVDVFARGQGTLYRVLHTNCKLDSMVSPIDLSNGITWNLNNTIMYYIDSLSRKVVAFDYNLKAATIENRRVIFDFDQHDLPGFPDGMTTDTEDNLWVACWGASKVIKISKNGKLLQSIPIPATKVSSVAWGGPNWDILYVTTVKFGLSAEELASQPEAGSVFAITDLGSKGFEAKTASSCLINSN